MKWDALLQSIPRRPVAPRTRFLYRSHRARSSGGSAIPEDNRQAITAELPRLRRYARALLKDAAAADDLVQDCVERALDRIHLFRDGTNLRAWLFTIMHNTHVNALKRLNRRTDTQPLDPAIENRHAAPPTQDQGLAIRDLEAALARLAAEQREVVLLIGLEGMSYKETAEIVGVPVGTVMSRLARGRERLRRLMDPESARGLRKVK